MLMNIYKKRWKNVKERLDGDVFIAKNYGNIKYLSYADIPDEIFYFLIMPKDGQPIAVTSALDENRARGSAIKDIRTIGDLPYVQTYEKKYNKVLKRILKEIGAKKIVSDSKIGVKSKIKDIVRDMRIQKEDEEIRMLRKATDIVKKVADELDDIVRVGRSEIEIAEELNRIMIKHGSRMIWPQIISAGKNSAYPHHYPTDKIIKKGEVVVCDFGAYYKGYFSDVTRTILNGDKKMKKIYDIVLESHEKAIKSVAVNEKFKNIDMVARNVIQNHNLGKYFVHSLGHGLGLEIHESPSISPKSKDIVRKNMVFTIEPGIYIPGKGGVRIEDDILVGNDVKILTR
ncbi:MAG: M24 family metallopeptidase [Candidatus Aenigmatarchaeota archaeon]